MGRKVGLVSCIKGQCRNSALSTDEYYEDPQDNRDVPHKATLSYDYYPLS